jgi:hypothetical protein
LAEEGNIAQRQPPGDQDESYSSDSEGADGFQGASNFQSGVQAHAHTDKEGSNLKTELTPNLVQDMVTCQQGCKTKRRRHAKEVLSAGCEKKTEPICEPCGVQERLRPCSHASGRHRQERSSLNTTATRKQPMWCDENIVARELGYSNDARRRAEELQERAASGMRPHPTLPGPTENLRTNMTLVTEGVALPVKHCAFEGCDFTGCTDVELTKHISERHCTVGDAATGAHRLMGSRRSRCSNIRST